MAAMHAARSLLQHTRTAAAKRSWVLWLLALLVALKAAVPMLASAAAAIRGVALVEVCSVYGVHTQPLDHAAMSHAPHRHPEMADEDADLGAMEHDMGAMAAHEPAGNHPPAVALEHREHCALSPLLGHAIAAVPSMAPVLLHAPAQTVAALAPEPVARLDAGRAWLAQRFHAPPRLA